jgi:PAS domain S-box-containing protein
MVFLDAFIPTAVVFYPVLTALLGSLIDNTVQDYALRQQLAISQQRFRAIFDQTFQFVGLLERDGMLIEANQTALAFAGLQPEDVINKPFWEARWWSLSEKTKSELQAAIKRTAQGEFVRYNADVLGIDNHIITIDFSLKPIFDANGDVVYIIPEGRDITAELLARQHETDLRIERERNANLNQFIIDSSHHMRTPIAIMGSAHDLIKKYAGQLVDLVDQLSELKDNTPDADTKKRIVIEKLKGIGETCERRTEQMERATTRFNSLLDNLTELATLDMKSNSDGVSTDLAQMLRNLFEDYQPVANQNNLQLTINIEGDCHQFRQNHSKFIGYLKT